jgi:Flp pilus assembly protein TadD
MRIRYSLLIIVLSLSTFTVGLIRMHNPRCFSPSYYKSKLEEKQDKKYLKYPYFFNAKTAYENGHYDEAVEELLKETKIHVDNALAYYLLGKIYEDHYIKGDKYYKEMAENYEKYIKLRPTREFAKHAKLKVAQFYVKEGLLKRDAEKLRIAEQYLNSLDKSDGSVRMALGAIYLDAGIYDKAIEVFEKSANLPPGEFKLKYNSLGLAYIKKEMYSNAVRVLEIAVFIDPRDKYAHNNLGFAYVQQGRLKEAKPHFAEALRIDSSYNNARRNLNWVERQLSKKEETDNTRSLVSGKK